MVKVTYLRPGGEEIIVEVAEGTSVMQAALANDISEIVAECGGTLACATCHVYVDENWIGKIPPRGEEEEYMLDEAFELRDNSRLSCQIIMNEELDGLKVFLARNPD